MTFSELLGESRWLLPSLWGRGKGEGPVGGQLVASWWPVGASWWWPVV